MVARQGREDRGFHSAATADRACSASLVRNVSEHAGSRRVYALHTDGS
ncbi:hypothetical protein [Peterkaempfera griseoplana]|nr:hypothetical protein [Peterkaempfera griseoplana]